MPGQRKPAVTVVIALLKAALEIPVDDKVPKTIPPRFVRVVRVGGPRKSVATDGPMITCECWADTGLKAEVLALKVADILEDSPSSFVDYVDDEGEPQQAWISSWTEIGGPVDNPDPDRLDKGRWSLTVELGIATNI